MSNIRVTRVKDAAGSVIKKVGTLHLDGLGSVRAVTDEAGLARERTTFRPYGEEMAALTPLTLPETKGYIGERYDAAAGLQYLNARYYDPKLAMFIQPDWWEVTREGVGTNRYGYALGDPVNGRDPGGNKTVVTVDESEKKDPNGADVDGKIGIEIDASVDNSALEEAGMTVEQVKTLVESAYTGIVDGVIVHGKAGTYYVETRVKLVEPGQSDYIIDVNNRNWTKGTQVTGHGNGTKVLHFDSAKSGPGSLAHEFGHLAGMRDHYDEVYNASGIRIKTIAHEGWSGNIMADGKVIGAINGGKMPEGMFDGRNVNEVLDAPDYHSPENGYAVRNGVMVKYK